jgi:two-component system chemotaxis sensor kinase CheA
MLPIGMTFSKFKRLVRSLSQELHKEIEFITEGADTELDKTLIERLADPLVHLMRNSIDHGIELPQVREAAGKPRQGTIHLSARHSGNHVLITIKDDGAGLDAAGIREKAIQKGLIAPDAELAEQDLFSLIFQPGFSTAKEVTSVSGRGLGLDVVKKALDALRGSIEISSSRNKGTTLTLTLPLTLAIIDGFLTTVGGESFIFPLTEVEECLELTQKNIEDARGRRLVQVRGRLVPYVRLREQFLLGGGKPELEHIVIVRSGQQRVGFVVDAIVGEHQTVIKSLGGFYRQVDGISGATILGNGTVALIVDVRTLMQAAEREEMALRGSCARCAEDSEES